MTDDTPISASVPWPAHTPLPTAEDLEWVCRSVESNLAYYFQSEAVKLAMEHLYGDGSFQPTGILNAKPPAQPKIRNRRRLLR
jgi:hypothetical protein